MGGWGRAAGVGSRAWLTERPEGKSVGWVAMQAPAGCHSGQSRGWVHRRLLSPAPSSSDACTAAVADSYRLRAFAAAAVGPLRRAILRFYAQVGPSLLLQSLLHHQPVCQPTPPSLCPGLLTHAVCGRAPTRPLARQLIWCHCCRCRRLPAIPTACCPSRQMESLRAWTAATRRPST